MTAKRLRVFAGPNGSGKTTIVNELSHKIQYGVYVNADDIEKILRESEVLSFTDYKLEVSQNILNDFFLSSTFAPIMRNEPDLWKKLSVTNNQLSVSSKIDSYLCADIAEFIRQQLLENGISLTYETVMSHRNKIDFLDYAHSKGYRIYLYYIATEDPYINMNRVNIRVNQNGHNVNPEKIKDRYYRSLQQLKSAIKVSNRAFL
jgi:predicted ABC-type ATPase